MNQLIKINKLEKGDKYFTAAQVKNMIDSCENLRDKFYLTWHFETGIRVSDIVGQVNKKTGKRELGQEINNVDWDNNRINTYDHKKDEWRYIYFNNKTRSMLKIWLKERQRLDFKDRRLFPYSEKTCNRIIKKYAKIIGHPNAELVGSHWCRHTYIRLSRQVGRDLKVVQQNTGDTVKTLLEWYSDLNKDDLLKEIEEKNIL